MSRRGVSSTRGPLNEKSIWGLPRGRRIQCEGRAWSIECVSVVPCQANGEFMCVRIMLVEKSLAMCTYLCVHAYDYYECMRA